MLSTHLSSWCLGISYWLSQKASRSKLIQYQIFLPTKHSSLLLSQNLACNMIISNLSSFQVRNRRVALVTSLYITFYPSHTLDLSILLPKFLSHSSTYFHPFHLHYHHFSTSTSSVIPNLSANIFFCTPQHFFFHTVGEIIFANNFNSGHGLCLNILTALRMKTESLAHHTVHSVASPGCWVSTHTRLPLTSSPGLVTCHLSFQL